MSFSYVLSKESRVAVVRGEGSGSFAESKRTLLVLAEDLSDRPPCGVVLDVRHLRYTPSADETREFAVLLRTLPRAYRGPIAIVVTAGFRRDVARLFATYCGSLGGPEVEVFTRVDHALDWVTADLAVPAGERLRYPQGDE